MHLGPLGLPELVIIVVVVVLLFGARRLPKIARDVSRMVSKARREVAELKDDLDITKPDRDDSR